MIRVIRETHETPKCVKQTLTRAGGRNRFGEANYRAVWGWNRLTWIGGKWEDRELHGGLVRETIELRREPKYHAVNRWHVERWCPPEMYGSPEDWRKQTLEIEGAQSVPALGPYPDRGEYELAFTLEGPQGEFVQLTPAIVERVARTIEFCRGMPAVRRRAAVVDREAQQEREFDRAAEDILSV